MGTAEARVRPNTPAASSLGPSPLEERVLEETRARPLERLTARDRAAFVAVGGSFLAVALLLLGLASVLPRPGVVGAGLRGRPVRVRLTARV